MSQFNSAKYKACALIIAEEREVESVVSLRKRCIARFVEDGLCTTAGASTYFANLTAGERGVVHKVVGAVKKVAAVVEPKGLGDDVEMFSAVTAGADRIAIDVKMFTDKDDCVKYCGDYKHFVKGIQKMGAKVGVLVEFDEDGEEVMA